MQSAANLRGLPRRSVNGMKLTDTALSISRHLQRFANDKSIAEKLWTDGNGQDHALTLYWGPVCYRAGSRAKVKYVAYQYESSLTKSEAEEYLAWLNAGNIGTHRDVKRS
jgi:hypothetical protein